MMDRTETAGATAAVPEARLAQRSRFPLIWSIPLMAALIGAWLVYTTLAARGPRVTITFTSAAGLEAGKTKVKYRELDMGLVEDVRLSADREHILVTARMNKEAEPELLDGTQFWVERPRLSAGGVSGLSTLVSGSFIGMIPGSGPAARSFTGLADAPVQTVTVPGRRYLLTAPALGSVSAGSAIYFRGVAVGEVLGYRVDGERGGVDIYAFIRQPYDLFVRPGSRFWNASGIDVSVGASGVDVKTESLEALLAGGIAFDVPLTAAEPAAEGSRFPLYRSYASIEEAQYTVRVPYLLRVPGTVAGLEPNAPVTFRGIKVGYVEDVRLDADVEALTAAVLVTIELEPQRLGVAGPVTPQEAQERMAKLVEKGLRAQLATANLLTGQLVVSLEFVPDAAPARLDLSGKYPAIPTLPTETAKLEGKVSQILERVADLPLPLLMTEAQQLLQSAQRIVASKDVENALRDVSPLLASATQTSNALRGTLKQTDSTLGMVDGLAGPDSELKDGAVRALKDVSDAARSVRSLANMLVQNPSALIRGRTGSSP